MVASYDDEHSGVLPPTDAWQEVLCDRGGGACSPEVTASAARGARIVANQLTRPSDAMQPTRLRDLSSAERPYDHEDRCPRTVP